MAKSVSNKALDQLREEIEELKLIYEYPKYFIGNYFNDLKNDLNLAFAKKKLATRNLQYQMKIEAIWTDLRYQIEAYEKDCRQNQDELRIDPELSKKLINFAEDSYSQLLSNRYVANASEESTKPTLEKSNSDFCRLFSRTFSNKSNEEISKSKIEKTSNLLHIVSASEKFKKFKPMISICENEPVSDEFQDLYDLIYDERKMFERLMFLNKTMFFIRSDSNENIEENKKLFAHLDPNTNAGVLVFIETEYLDSKTINFFKR